MNSDHCCFNQPPVTLYVNILQQLIRSVIIIDCVFYSINAFELIKNQTKIDKYDITVREKAELDELRKSMHSIGVTIIEHYTIYHFSTFGQQPEFAIFRYTNVGKYFIIDAESSRELVFVYISAVQPLQNQNVVRMAKGQRYPCRSKQL